ncbi:MAG: NADH-quinone oxidoreductase subunit C [Bryobacterales bacterium]|nr:NADH-quinone oxidoreductase subunit C [Bryobacterales bacterium]
MVPDTLKEIRVVQALEALPSAVVAGKVDRNELTLEIEPARIVEVCRLLKDTLQFNRLSAVTCVDWYPTEPRFEVIYHLHAIPSAGVQQPPARNERLRLKCKVSGEKPEIDSVYGVWRSADWYEREVFDLFGVVFRNHPGLKRILMPDDWEGHPLRKDYPVHGYKYSYPQE